MKIFYMVRKIKDGWYRQEIAILDLDVFISNIDIIESMTKTKLIGYDKYSAYLLDLKNL